MLFQHNQNKIWSLFLTYKLIRSLSLLVLWYFQPHLHSVPDMLSSVFVVSILSPLKLLLQILSSLALSLLSHLLRCYLIKGTSLTMLSKIVIPSLSILNLCLLLLLSIYSLLLYSLCVYIIHMYNICVYTCILIYQFINRMKTWIVASPVLTTLLST